MIDIRRIRRSVAMLVCIVALPLGLALTAAAPASAATAAPATKVSVEVVVHSETKADGIHPADVVITTCDIWAEVTKESGGYLYTEAGVACPGDPDFAVSDDWGFYSSGSLYALDGDFGTSTDNFYLVAEYQGGGAIGHRTVEWCVVIDLNDGGTGSGCLVPAVNI
jgi:hypothetical protein